MDQPKISEELQRMKVEPLLPIERKLVAWSLILGVVLLGVLLLVNQWLFG
jgi:hypothetical protein